jgi:hypothetical protein
MRSCNPNEDSKSLDPVGFRAFFLDGIYQKCNEEAREYVFGDDKIFLEKINMQEASYNEQQSKI